MRCCLHLEHPKPASVSPAATPGNPDAHRLVERALNAVGTMDKLASIAATRQLWTSVQDHSGSTISSEVERIVVYPDRLYVEARSAAGTVNTLVVSSQFAYASNGQGKSQVPAPILEDYRTGMKFDIAYVAQHMSEFAFSYDGQESVAKEKCDRVRVKHNDGKEESWSIDQTGKILRRSGRSSSGEYSVESSDFRLVDGVNVAFHRHGTNGSVTTGITVKLYQVNPPRYAMNAALFDTPTEQLNQTSPTQQSSAGLRIRVLEEKSVPYEQKMGGGPSTSCNISGGSNTTFSANTIGNSTYGNAKTTTGLHMNCATYDTTMNWPHVLNVMLVEASDGNAYLIACDRAWALV